MQRTSDAVSHIIPNLVKTVLDSIFVNGTGNIGNSVALAGVLDALIEALPGHLDELLRLFRDRACSKSSRAVSVISHIVRAHVDLDNVAFADLSAAWNAMNDFVIDGTADGSGEAAVTKEGRLGAATFDDLTGSVIKFASGDARRDQFAAGSASQLGDLSRLRHEFDLMGRFDLYHTFSSNAVKIRWRISSTVPMPSTERSLPIAS